MEFSAWVSIGSLAVALVAVIVGPLVTLKVSRQQTMAPMRLKRIEDIRDCLSKMISLSFFINEYFTELEKVERLKYSQSLTTAYNNILLLLTPNKDDHSIFIDKLDDMMILALKEDSSSEQLIDIQHQIIELSKDIFAEQWEKIKKGK